MGVLAYILEHGITDLSLRPLAEALGASTFKLIYHFGSKGELVQAAIEAALAAQVEEVRSWLAADAYVSVGAFMKRYWDWFREPENQKIARVFFEVNGLALRDPQGYPNALKTSFTEGIGLEKLIIAYTGYQGELVEQYSTAVCAASMGLQLDLLNTGDLERTTKAYYLIADVLDAQLNSLRDQHGDSDLAVQGLAGPMHNPGRLNDDEEEK